MLGADLSITDVIRRATIILGNHFYFFHLSS
jgi:hypothetical protein